MFHEHDSDQRETRQYVVSQGILPCIRTMLCISIATYVTRFDVGGYGCCYCLKRARRDCLEQTPKQNPLGTKTYPIASLSLQTRIRPPSESIRASAPL